MFLTRKEYKVNGQAEKVAGFFVACKVNPTNKVKLTEAMRVRGYFDCESANLLL
jgi:hypothetical protein